MDRRQNASSGHLSLRRRDLIALIGGVTIVLPFAVRAQHKATPVIGFLSTTLPDQAPPQLMSSFQLGLRETGYVEGQTVVIEFRWAGGHYDRMPALAADLVSRKVDLIVAFAPPAALAAKNATSTIPIVFTVGTDPVAAGLVASLARPGGNLTGVSFIIDELIAKRFELLCDLVPLARTIALLVNPTGPEAEITIRAAQQAAHARGVRLLVLKAGTESEIDAAFASLVQQRASGLVIGGDPFFDPRRDQLVALAARDAVPAIYYFSVFVTSGGLISYGASLASLYHQVGTYAGRILKGEKPADLPVMRPTRFELVINLRTARALGLTIPQSILAGVDQVIE